MLLVRAAGGTVDAQAAALLHDIAHTALSHVVDSTFGYVVHEVDKLEYLNTTTIPDILRKHGLAPEEVLEEANYPLLELDAPAIWYVQSSDGVSQSPILADHYFLSIVPTAWTMAFAIAGHSEYSAQKMPVLSQLIW